MAEPDSLFLLRKLFDHDCWANQTVADALSKANEPPPQALRLMAHIIGAEWLWHFRLTGSPPKFAVWPDISAARWAAEVPLLQGAWREYLDTADFRATISYTNSKGEQFDSNVLDVLAHVPMHSHYHRGQIATLMRQHGLEPSYTDFIHATRTNAI